MARPYNTLGRRILRLLTEEYGGPRLKPVLRRLMATGQIVMQGTTRGAVYALGKPRKA